jgi:hypothetical protein
VLQVLGEGVAIDQNIVKEHEHEVAKERAKNLVHEGLERCRGIGQAEGHDHELEMPVMSPERCLVDIIGVHVDLVISAAKVELGEAGGTAEFV